MGKNSKRIINKKNKVNNKQTGALKESKKMSQEVKSWRNELKGFAEEENYAEVINTLAKIIEAKYYEAELMYDGAFAYFMLGDYTRAASWCNNVMSFDAGNVPARVLLARICVLEDRIEDGLAIFDFVLEKLSAGISEEMRYEIEEILEYYGNTEEELIRSSYPNVAKFLKLDDAIVDDLKMDDTENKVPVSAEEVKVEEVKTDDPVVNIKSMLAKMRNLVAQDNDSLESAMVENSLAPEIVADSEETEKLSENVFSDDVTDNIAKIEQQSIDLISKIRLYNAFAAAAFMDNNTVSARAYLNEALLIDSAHEATIRNMAMLAKSEGDMEEAMEWAGKMPVADFVLLNALKC